jgi:hypothetical protein
MKKGTQFNVDSGYLLPALDLPGVMPSLPIHQLTLSSGSDGAGQLQLDPNGCGLNEFGVPGICTKIAIQGFQANVKLLKESAGKKLFAIELKGYTGPALRVVLRARKAGAEEFVAQLLVLANDGSIQRIVPLKAAMAAAAA